MEKGEYSIEKYSGIYKDQVRELIGTTLADISVIDRSTLPIDDEDLDRIDEVYSGKGGFWIAVRDGVVQGTVAVRDLGENEARLRRMFVRKDLHGTGLGQQLLDLALAHAREQEFTKVTLNTHEQMQRAHRFYERNGFKKVGKETDKFYYELSLKPTV